MLTPESHSKMRSAAAANLIREKESILKEWTKITRERIGAARNLRHPILTDTMPAFLQNLAEALDSSHERPLAPLFSTIASEHGGERVRLTEYNPADLIFEYQILKEVLLKRLDAEVLTAEARNVIEQSFNESIRQAVNASFLVQNELKERFVAALSHDLRNPIGVVKMSAEVIRENLEEISHSEARDEAYEMTRMILENISRAERMIQEVLEVTMVRQGGRPNLEMKEAEIQSLIHQVVRFLEPRHRDRIQVNGAWVHGYWSPLHLERAFENLITNAIKYGDPKKPIRIRIHTGHERVCVSVHNEGPVIPMEERETIFQPYRRALSAKEGKKKGWGIGLAFVRAIAEGHGGSILVESLESQGTTFTFDIPIDARPYQNEPISESFSG